VSLVVAAAGNNADWCAAVCRSHGIEHDFGERAWRSRRPTPPYYPEAVTLRPEAMPAEVLPSHGAAPSGYSVKDSFAALDLSAYGFAELFQARWIHRPPATPTAARLRAERVTAAGLSDWQAAWDGGAEVPDVFRPALLDDPDVAILAFHDGGKLRGGVALNRSRGVVGVSNVFAVDRSELPAVWSAAIEASAGLHPGLPLVGYERGDDLAYPAAAGFAELGPLRVWSHEC
jgi:hypothetical protein